MPVGPAVHVDGKLLFGETPAPQSVGAVLPRFSLQMAVPPEHAIEIENHPFEHHFTLAENGSAFSVNRVSAHYKIADFMIFEKFQ